MPKDAIDPRYNPAFQRGYDRSRHGTEPHLRAADPVERIPRDITRGVPGPTVVPPPVPAPPQAVTQPQAAASAPTAPGESGIVPNDGTDIDGASTAAPQRTGGMELRGNPFVIVLLGIGAALTVFGIWAQFQIAELYSGGPQSAEDFIRQQFFVTVGPWCMTLGIATLVTVLVMYALHWRSSKE
jgi:hypothetical protein